MSVNRRYRKEVAGKPWSRSSSSAKSAKKDKAGTSNNAVKKKKTKKKSKLVDPAKTIIPVTTYLRRIRVSVGGWVG